MSKIEVSPVNNEKDQKLLAEIMIFGERQWTKFMATLGLNPQP